MNPPTDKPIYFFLEDLDYHIYVGEFRLPHARTGGVLIVAHKRVSTLTQYLTWFGKTAYIHRRVHIIRDI
jgi:hypothetical protein